MLVRREIIIPNPNANISHLYGNPANRHVYDWIGGRAHEMETLLLRRYPDAMAERCLEKIYDDCVRLQGQGYANALNTLIRDLGKTELRRLDGASACRVIRYVTGTAWDLLLGELEAAAFTQPGDTMEKRVMIAAATLRMSRVLENARDLLPSTTTNYSDEGVQLITRCMGMEYGGRAIRKTLLANNTWAKTTIHISPEAVGRMVTTFIDAVDALKYRCPVFDFKKDNIGIEYDSDATYIIRLIDVDADDQARTYHSIHQDAYEELQNRKDHEGSNPEWDHYQTLFTAIYAIIQWLSPGYITSFDSLVVTGAEYRRHIYLKTKAEAIVGFDVARDKLLETIDNILIPEVLADMGIPYTYMQAFTDTAATAPSVGQLNRGAVPMMSQKK